MRIILPNGRGIRIVKTPTHVSFQAIRDASGNVLDYRNVRIRGYLSTWQHVTPSDTAGDYVVKGAFRDTIPHFMQNPVMLVNHTRSVECVAGVFTTVREDDRGLYVEGRVTDSPSELARTIRFNIVERHLRTLSMAGLFRYGADGRAIEKVSLHEGSLVAVPANPDALFTVA